MHIHVEKGRPGLFNPFLVTRFTDQEVDGYYYNGYEICLATDPRAVYPAPHLKFFYRYKGYLIDDSKVLLTIPSIDYTYMADEDVCDFFAECQNVTLCERASERRREWCRLAASQGQCGIPIQNRILFHFPQDELLNNDVYGARGCHNVIKTESYIVGNVHKFGQEEIDVFTGRFVWRVTITNNMTRMARRNPTSPPNIPSVASLMSRLRLHANRAYDDNSGTFTSLSSLSFDGVSLSLTLICC